MKEVVWISYSGRYGLFPYRLRTNASVWFQNKHLKIMFQWLEENIGKRGGVGGWAGAMWTYNNQDEFLFKREEDRLMFILMFSGNCFGDD